MSERRDGVDGMDVARVRAETPGLGTDAYLQNAGASLVPAPVLAAQMHHLELESRLGGYAAEDREADRFDAVYASVARLLGTTPDAIALVESATVAWQRAFSALRIAAGDRILTGEAEYGANYVAFLQLARRTGARIEVVPSDDSGQLDLRALAGLLDDRVKLVAITWVPSNGGLVNPAAAVGALTRAAGIPYLLDACQAAGQLPIDVDAIGCDFLSATGRKFLRGPRGTGFLYVRPGVLADLEPFPLDHAGTSAVTRHDYTLRSDARRFETWESNRAARLGLGAAVDYALAVGLQAIEQRCAQLAERLRAGLAALPGLRLWDRGAVRSAIVTFTVQALDARVFAARARDAGIVVGVSAPQGTPLDSEVRDLPHLIRASPHYFNSEAELDRLLTFTSEAVR